MSAIIDKVLIKVKRMAPLQTLAILGGTGAVLGLFFSEWKVITRNLPIYNTKYESADYQYLRDRDAAEEESRLAAIEKEKEKVELLKEIEAMLASK